MGKIIMLYGLPSSGKTSWAEERVKKGGCIKVSMDDIRDSMLGGWSIKKEQLALKIRDDLVRFGISQGKNVIIDATNLDPKHERALRNLSKELGCAFEIEDSFLKKTPEECIEYDLKRGDKAVGSKVIWEMFYKWIAPDPIKKLDKDFDKPRCIICDLDGTLAINTSGRSYRDLTRVDEDIVEPFMACVLDALYEYGLERGGAKYPTIILLTGRNESCRELTEKWLDRNGIQFDKLLMRKEGDTRPDVEVKEEIYHNEIEPYYAVLGAFEDRNRCARLWRSLGIRVLQAGFPEIEF